MPEQTTLPEASEVIEQTTDRRELLAQALESSIPEVTETSAEQRARDEAGRFAPKAKEQEPPAEIPPAPAPEKQRLTTWKKDYIPLHEKLEQGLPLTADEAKKLASYNFQRESEYATGVSVHKERAQRLESVEKAIEPFMPELQKHGITPDVWISNLGRSHHTLATGNPQQKLQAFQQLAEQYGIPLGAVQQSQAGGQIDPTVMQLMGQIQQLQGQVQTVTGWREQQEQQRVTSALDELAKDAATYPHFGNEKVKAAMAQLLETGSAPDLKTAYAEAEWMVPEVRELKLAGLSQGQQTNTAQQTARDAVARAKAKNISVRSSAPSGLVNTNGPKDRRAALSEAFDSLAGRV